MQSSYCISTSLIWNRFNLWSRWFPVHTMPVSSLGCSHQTVCPPQMLRDNSMIMSRVTSVMARYVFLLRLIIPDRGTRSPCFKSKGTILGRGASKIKTRSMALRCGLVNWKWWRQISLKHGNSLWPVERGHGRVSPLLKELNLEN